MEKLLSPNMSNLEQFFIILASIQILHSHEEMYFHFEKRWPLWKMSRRFFVTFEYIFSAFLLVLIFTKSFPFRDMLMISFNVSMFANGIWHLMWAGVEKRYVPGLMTAPLFIIAFLIFYFRLF